jgi:alkanesulfonate monooxygenase SsuD/methylene tetrahydromethanopterin reductase-like flavin-dependent oxidoreductase (luciferase family)
MWSDDNGPFDGRHYQLAATLCVPPPIQRPGPKILIGGGGEQKTLKLVARYADACNLFAGDAALVAHKIDVLARHCEAEGRDPAEIEKTIVWGTDPLDDVDAFLAGMEQYAKLGVEKVWLGPNVPDPAGWTARVTEALVPRLAEL